ncbi:MAG: ABC transporter permease [Patescibacteria group bacterium]|jgi:putative ABC transport system permease protein
MQSLNIALKSLQNNKLRTVLTVIGIIIGIAAVIIVMSAGEGLKGEILGQLEAFGSKIIQIEIKVPTTGKNSTQNASTMAQGVAVTTFTLEDAEAIGKLPNIENYYVMIMDQEVVSYLDQQKSVNLIGTMPAYVEMGKTKTKIGRFFTDDENNELARVVVLGSKLSAKLFGNQDPLGQEIKIGKNKFRVVGVMDEAGATFGFDFDQLAYVPVKTLQKIVMGIDYIQTVTANIIDTAKEDQTADDIVYLLRTRHEIDDPQYDDFAVTTMTEARDMINTIFNGITLLLIAIAGISLIVGGVGIMNIMYVSVSERTFEIGLRKAVGAKKAQILWQFLYEAIIITLLGGALGIIAGIGFAYFISFAAGLLGYSWQFILPPQSIVIAFGFCGAVGLIFGYYPARHAANMNPIAALRHE